MQQSNGYIIGFAIGVCVVCSLLLAGVSTALKDRQEMNQMVDRQKNILKAVGFSDADLEGKDGSAVTAFYNEHIKEMVVKTDGSVAESLQVADLPSDAASGLNIQPDKGLPLYMRKDSSGAPLSYAFPAVGKGLWSKLFGFLAVKPDGDEIVGLSFYKHGETPGLGANIEAKWFTDNFIGKHLYEAGKLVGVTVAKGKAADMAGVSKSDIDRHAVDGMSGATLTGNGVMKMTKVAPKPYAAFFKKGGR